MGPEIHTDESVEYAGDSHGGTATVRVDTLDDEGFNRKRHIEKEIVIPPSSVIQIQIASKEVKIVPNDVNGNPRVQDRE